MADGGEVTFTFDIATGMVLIGVRAPMAISASRMHIPIEDFLERAAELQIQISKLTREARTQQSRAVVSS